MTPEFQSRLNGLCAAYREFLAGQVTELLVGDVVVLYGTEVIEACNEVHEVAEYLPGYVCIGSDSGDYAFLLKRDGSEAVVWEDPGNFATPTLEVIHASFPQWLADGCPLPESEELPIPLSGRIWLIARPPGGMRDMMAINKLLALNWSIPQMKQAMENVPAVLIEDGCPYRVGSQLEEQGQWRAVLGFSERGSVEVTGYGEV